MTDCRITIVTPTYNRADLIGETVKSIINQTLQSLRYIIVDDGSSDNTVDVISQFGDALEYVSHENRGEAFSTTRGWQMADTEYFAMVSSDDPMLPNWLERAIAFMDQHPNVLVGYPDWYLIDAESNKKQLIEVQEYTPEKLLGWLHCLPGPGAIIRRSAIEDIVELRRSTYRYMPDMDSWMNLALRGPFARIPEALATWREHPASTSVAVRSKERAEQSIRMVREFYARNDLPPEVRPLKTMALSRAHYLAAIVVHRANPLLAFYYYLQSRMIMPADPAHMPPDLRRKPLHSPVYLARRIYDAWRRGR